MKRQGIIFLLAFLGVTVSFAKTADSITQEQAVEIAKQEMTERERMWHEINIGAPLAEGRGWSILFFQVDPVTKEMSLNRPWVRVVVSSNGEVVEFTPEGEAVVYDVPEGGVGKEEAVAIARQVLEKRGYSFDKIDHTMVSFCNEHCQYDGAVWIIIFYRSVGHGYRMIVAMDGTVVETFKN